MSALLITSNSMFLSTYVGWPRPQTTRVVIQKKKTTRLYEMHLSISFELTHDISNKALF